MNPSKQPESNKEIIYKGRTLGINPHGKTKITVDNKSVQVERNEKTGKYESLYLPYQTFDTLEELGQMVVDNVHEFMTDDMKKKLRGDK